MLLKSISINWIRIITYYFSSQVPNDARSLPCLTLQADEAKRKEEEFRSQLTDKEQAHTRLQGALTNKADKLNSLLDDLKVNKSFVAELGEKCRGLEAEVYGLKEREDVLSSSLEEALEVRKLSY